MYYCTNAAADLYGLAQEKNGSYFFFWAVLITLALRFAKKSWRNVFFSPIKSVIAL